MATGKELAGNNEQPRQNAGPGALAEVGRKAALFYFGALATAIEESYEFAHRLAEQTETAEKKGRELADAMMERRKKAIQKAQEEGAKVGEQVKGRTVVPANGDGAGLKEKIARLGDRIDEFIRA
jgi:hypothetical protein